MNQQGNGDFATGRATPARPASRSFKFSNLFVRLAGVDPRRLARHTSSAQVVIKAIGITMFCFSGPIVAAAMGSYIWLNTPNLDAILRFAVAATGGVTWALVVLFALDRTLLIAADAVGIDRWLLPSLAFLMRAALAALMASLFAEMLVEWQFAGIATETAQHIALDVSETDAGRIERLNGLPTTKDLVTGLADKSKTLEQKYDTLPTDIVAALKAVARCEREVRNLQALLLAAAADSDETTRLQKAVDEKEAACRSMRKSAARQRDAYHEKIAALITDNNTARKSADKNFNSVSANVASQRSSLDAITRDGYASVSGRKIGFEKAEQLHPEIRRSAQLWWLAFFVAEMLPVLLKTLLFPNNPVSAESQADLAEVAGRHRVRSRRAALVERELTAILARPETRSAVEKGMIPYVVAGEHLLALNSFMDELVAVHLRQQNIAREYPDLAARTYEAYAAAVANALDVLRARRATNAAAE